jgi:hypothetical protein
MGLNVAVDAALPQAIKVGGGLHTVPTRRAGGARVNRNPPYHLLTRQSQRIGPILSFSHARGARALPLTYPLCQSHTHSISVSFLIVSLSHTQTLSLPLSLSPVLAGFEESA